jgi:sporulation protein YlmC with PRC-barrel domain
MILSDLMRSDVYDAAGEKLGRVADVRFQLEGRSTPPRARVVGIVVSPRSAASFLGYERSGFERPVVLAALLRWIHRGSFLVPWGDVRRINDREVLLWDGYERLPSTLPEA